MLLRISTRLALLALGLASAPALAQTQVGVPAVIVPAPVPGIVQGAPLPPPVIVQAAPVTPGIPVFPIAPVAPGVATVVPVAPAPAVPLASPGVISAPMVTGVPGDSPLNGGDRTSAVADVVSTHSVDELLQRAEQSVRQGNLALANELVERAEAQALTRSTIAGTETIPNRVGPVARMAEARAAIARRDPSTAAMLIAEAASLARAQGL